MTQDNCFLLGKITKPYSFKGEVVLWMDVDDSTPYEGVDTLWLPQQGFGPLRRGIPCGETRIGLWCGFPI